MSTRQRENCVMSLGILLSSPPQEAEKPQFIYFYIYIQSDWNERNDRRMIERYNEDPRNLRLSRNIAKVIKARRIRLGAYWREITIKSWLGSLKKREKLQKTAAIYASDSNL